MLERYRQKSGPSPWFLNGRRETLYNPPEKLLLAQLFKEYTPHIAGRGYESRVCGVFFRQSHDSCGRPAQSLWRLAWLSRSGALPGVSGSNSKQSGSWWLWPFWGSRRPARGLVLGVGVKVLSCQYRAEHRSSTVPIPHGTLVKLSMRINSGSRGSVRKRHCALSP